MATEIDEPRSVAALAAAIRSGATSAVAAIESTFAAIESLDPTLNSFTATTAERAIGEARAIDVRRARGEALPPNGGGRSRLLLPGPASGAPRQARSGRAAAAHPLRG